MAKKIVGYIKLQIPAGKANPSPPVGPALGQRGLNIMQFVQGIQRGHPEHGAGHADPGGDHRVRRPHLQLHHQDAAQHATSSRRRPRSTRAARPSGKGAPVGRVTMAQLREIAEQKMKDMNANDVDGAVRMLAGSARSMGLTVVEG